MPQFLIIFAAGVAVLGVGAFYALHHLRSRPNRVAAATLLFWQQAVRPQQTRSLWQRKLSHRKTFALLSAITLLTAIGMIIGPLMTSDQGQPVDVIVIDTGAAMAMRQGHGQTLIETAAEKALADLSSFGRSPALISAGPVPQLECAAGGSVAVLRRELSGLAPQQGPSAARLALQLAASVQSPHPGRIVWYTAESKLPAGLPDEVLKKVERRSISAPNAVAIVSVTREANANSADGGTLRVAVAGTSQSVLSVQAKTETGETTENAVQLQNGRGDAEFSLAVGARKIDLTLRGAAGVEAMHRATFQSPDRVPISFRFIGTVPASLRAALLACGSESADGTIAVTAGENSVPAGVRAAIIVEPAATTADRTNLSLLSGRSRPVSLEGARVQSVPRPLPGVPRLLAGESAVASMDSVGGMQRLHLSQSLLDDQADLPRRAAFPVLIADWCDQLAGRAAGVMSVPWQRVAEDPLWAGPANWPDVGEVIPMADAPVEVLAASDLSLPPSQAGIALPWADIVTGFALLLAVIEGLLFAARKIV